MLNINLPFGWLIGDLFSEDLQLVLLVLGLGDTSAYLDTGL